jgi:hypothetical protein
MKGKVQVVTITDDGQETTREIACVERQDLTPETFGLSPAPRLSALWEDASQQGRSSHGVSDRLWDAPGRQSAPLSVWVSGAHDDDL